MKPQDDCDTLLVVVGTPGQARVIQTALAVRGIATQVRRDVINVVEFGNRLGIHPSGIYVSSEVLVRAREVLVAEGLPNNNAPQDIRSSFGM